MDITPTAISTCSTGGHVTITATVNGVSRTVQFLRSDFSLDVTDFEAVKEAAIARFRSAVKEAGATTPAQIQAALVGKLFKL